MPLHRMQSAPFIAGSSRCREHQSTACILSGVDFHSEFEEEIAEYLADEDILPEQIQQLMPFLKYLNGRNDY